MVRDGADRPPLGASLCDRLLCQPKLRRRVPDSADADEQWATAALRRSGSLGPYATVRGVELRELSGDKPNGGGKSGTRLVKLELDVVDRTGYTVPDMPQPPRSVIHKYASHVDQVPGASAHPLDLCAGCAGFGMRLGSLVMGVRIDRALSQEAAFYRDIAPALKRAGVSLPKVFHAGVEGSAAAHGCCFVCCCCPCCGCSVGGTDVRSSIFLEDLSLRGLTSIHVMAPETPPVAVMRAAIRMAARLHRWGWRGQRASRRFTSSLNEASWCATMTGQSSLVRGMLQGYGNDVNVESSALEKYLQVWRPVDWAEANRQAGIGPGGAAGGHALAAERGRGGDAARDARRGAGGGRLARAGAQAGARPDHAPWRLPQGQRENRHTPEGHRNALATVAVT